MSLWTPGGEHPVDRCSARPQDESTDGSSDQSRGDPLAGLSDEQREQAKQIAAQMEEVRRQLASVPAEVVVANHAMGLYELAAIHLSAQPPRFVQAQLAIDALGALVEGLQGRLGENESTLKDALGQIRLAYVQMHGGHTSPEE